MGQEEVCEVDIEAQKDNVQSEAFTWSRREKVQNKMEAMQKRIDELKEKVKNEGDLLHSEDSFKTNCFDEQFKVYVNNKPNTFEQQLSENESGSDKSLYYSASNYSLCSLSTTSSDSAYSNFTKFVNNFVKNQSPKERLSLLQLHSKKQITLNMMRHSLSELDTRCGEELELIERSLEHLNRLGREFNINIQNDDKIEDRKFKALEYHNSNNGEELKVQSRSVFIWPHEERKAKLNEIHRPNPSFVNFAKGDQSNIIE